MATLEHLPTLWARALTASLHAPGCGCCRGGLGIVLDARSLEEDLLDFLDARHGAGEAGGVIALKRRNPGDFVNWLLSLRQSGLALQVAQAMAEDCANVLASIASPFRVESSDSL